MKLLYLTVSMPLAHGEAFLIPEAHELIRQGCAVLIVPRDVAGGVVNGDAQGLRAVCILRRLWSPRVLAAAAAEAGRHPFRAAKVLATLLGSRNCRTRLRNLAVFPKGLWLARLARHGGADHIHAHWLLTTATMAMVAGEVSGIPWSCTAHRADIAENNLLAVKLAKARFVRFISESGLRMAQRLCAGPVEPRGRLLHLGVSLPPWPPAPAPQPEPPLLVCPANLYPVKGHKYLLQAMAILRQRGVACRLDVAGSGGLRAELETMARDLALQDRVKFLGQVPHDALLDRYRRGPPSAVVLPSIDLGDNEHEGIPIALLEAMGYGIPVIATRTGGIPELLDGGAGMLVPPRDPTALADALQQVLPEGELRRRLAEAGRLRVAQGWAVETVVAQLLGLMQGQKVEVRS
ncbi:MAG: glycosyltransferase family 4 protein [Thermoguttaceae bacterium]|jgi:glycosyltransferase involved in cell wall biosynthesis